MEFKNKDKLKLSSIPLRAEVPRLKISLFSPANFIMAFVFRYTARCTFRKKCPKRLKWHATGFASIKSLHYTSLTCWTKRLSNFLPVSPNVLPRLCMFRRPSFQPVQINLAVHLTMPVVQL